MKGTVFLKIKIKSLAEEARIIKRETKIAKNIVIKNRLARHRIDVVRNECRHTHLAYGFLRGKEYHQIEPNSDKSIDWKKVRRMVENYGIIAPVWSNSVSYDQYQSLCKEAGEEKSILLTELDQWINRAIEVMV